MGQERLIPIQAFLESPRGQEELGSGGRPQPIIVALLIVLAIAVIPATVRYYQWLARHVLPRLVPLPTRLAIVILGLWVALPWIALTTIVWLARR